MDLRKVDLNLLVAFEALMDERSVTAAGHRLSIGQSAMSSTLSRLRAVLGDPVLIRRGRTMVPTPLAESLAGPVREALTRFDAILTREPLRFDPDHDRRAFTVMASEYAALAVLRPLLVALQQSAPHVELRIQTVSSTFAREMAAGAVDLTIVPPAAAPTDDSFRQQQLYVDPYVVAVDAAHPDIADSISLAQFSSLPYLASSNGHSRTLVETQLDELGIERRLEATTGFGLAPFLLRDTRMVTLLPLSLAAAVAPGAGLKLLRPPMPLEPIEESMVWDDRNDRDPGHRWLRERLIDIATRERDTTRQGLRV